MPRQAAQELVSIKGTKGGLLIYCNGQADAGTLEANLRSKLEAGKGFFKGAQYTLYADPVLEESVEQLLHQVCTGCGLTKAEQAFTKPEPVQAGRVAEAVSPPETWGKQKAATQGDTLLTQRTLRSGSKLSYDGNIMLLGDVNPGAEVTATGNILVMGALRGIAHAGCGGNMEAVIVAHKLHPSQLRIADKIARSPSSLKERPYPELAFATEEDGIVIEKYNPNKRR